MEISWKNRDELWVHFDFNELLEQYDIHLKNVYNPNDIKGSLIQNLPKMIFDVSKEVDGAIGTGMMSVEVYLDPNGIMLQFLGVQQPDSEDVEDEVQEGEYDQRFPGLELNFSYKKNHDSEYYDSMQNPAKRGNIAQSSANITEHKLLVFRFQNTYQMSEFVAKTGLASTTLRSVIYKDKKLYFLVLDGHISTGLLNRYTECANSIFPQQKQKNSALRESYLQEHGELIMNDSEGKSPIKILSEL